MRNFVFMMSIAAAIVIGMWQGPRGETADQYGNLSTCDEKLVTGNCSGLGNNTTECPGDWKAVAASPGLYRDAIFVEGTQSFCTDPKCVTSVGPTTIIGSAPDHCNATWVE